ncbi:hypothetical protein LG274_02745 [Micrococcus antarcticus]|uniref:hypothetical protein n=1 Tax=Micrococcus antarcticus TaxID=86171 RepID=UPI00385089FE
MDATSLITSGAIVVFLVQQAKRWMPGAWLPLLAVVLGVLVQIADHLATGGAATTAALWTAGVTGAGVGMAAAGAYDLAVAGRAPAEVVEGPPGPPGPVGPMGPTGLPYAEEDA